MTKKPGVIFNLLLSVLFCLFWAAQVQGQNISFTENKGQWDARIHFEADIPGGKMFLEKNGYSCLFVDEESASPFLQHPPGKNEKPFSALIKFHAVKVSYVGANPSPPIETKWQLPGYKNYFLGNDRSKWKSRVNTFNKVIYQNLYEGINLEVYSTGATVKCDYLIAPEVDPENIRIKYEGQEDLFIVDGKLLIRNSFNVLREGKPYAYQWIGDSKTEVECSYVLDGNVVGFKLGKYDKTKELIIDPVLIFATYSGSTADNFGFTATYDSKGNLYAGGNVTLPYAILPNGRYPATPGAFQVNFAGNNTSSGPYDHFPCDMAISKYDSSGSNLIWATYLGGTDNDYPHSLVVDQNDRLIIMGTTYSSDFPTDTLAFDTTYNGNADIVVVKFNDSATQLLGSTFLGGSLSDGILAGDLVYNYADDFRGDVFVDLDDNIYVASFSMSDNFPMSADAWQNSKNGKFDGIVSILDSSLAKLKWSTFYGGSEDDALYSIKIDREKNIVVGGGTKSTDLAVSSVAFQKTNGGGISDGLVAKFNGINKSLMASTYFGTNDYDQVYFVDVDLSNHIYIHGQTKGNIPLSAGVYGKPGRGQFIVKYNTDLDTILMSTVIGNRINNPDISPTAFLVDNCYNIYFAGWGSNTGQNGGSTQGLEVTPDAIQPNTDGNDFYLGVLKKNAASLIYATFFGGTQTDDHVDGGTSRFDKRGVVYHSICGSCPPGGSNFVSDIPTTPNAAFPTNSSPRCSNASFKLDFQITYAVEAKFTAKPREGCLPLTVNFTNKGIGTQFLWSFGDGTYDTTRNPVHTFQQAGEYTVWLAVLDSNSCNLRDSIYTTVNVTLKTTPDFVFLGSGCESKVQFVNKTDGALTYLWEFGDGSTSSMRNPEYEFDRFGTHSITLITNPGLICADTLVKDIHISEADSGELKIPNVFTPNSDGFNECFRIEGLTECDELEFTVFNRWAQKVFETDDAAFCWSGTNYKNGKELSEGAYYVIAKIRRANGKNYDYKGTITILR